MAYIKYPVWKCTHCHRRRYQKSQPSTWVQHPGGLVCGYCTGALVTAPPPRCCAPSDDLDWEHGLEAICNGVYD